MSIKGSRYVKPAKTTSAPTMLVSACCEERAAGVGRKAATLYREGVAVWKCEGRRAGTKWTGATRPVRLTLAEFWDWLDRLCAARRSVLLVAPGGADFLTLAGFWALTDAGRYRLHDSAPAGSGEPRDDCTRKRKPWVGRFVVAGTPDIISFKSDKGYCRVCSVTNWSDQGPAELASSVGVAMPERPAGQSDQWRDVHPREQADIVFRHMSDTISRWVRDDNGPFRDTASQCAVSIWRRKYYTEKVCRHDDENAARLEGGACHGGRQSVFYLGEVGTRLAIPSDADPPPPPCPYPPIASSAHRYDVRSMYPTFLRDCQFPVRLMSVLGEMGADDLRGLADHWGVIATVTVNTERAEYPCRHDHRTLFPVGEFTTVLAGPEIVDGHEHGCIARVHEVARYQLGRPFERFASAMLAARESARAAGDHVQESFVKRMSNAFGGKFAQRSDKWVPRPNKYCETRWGALLSRDATTGRLTRYRVLAGLPFELVPGRPGARLLAASYTYLTAYGRMAMAGIRDRLPPLSVLTQDTDGLWVTDQGSQAIVEQGLESPSTPGRLRLVDRSEYSLWYDSSHFYSNGRWTLAGYPSGFQCTKPGWVLCSEDVNPIRSTPAAAPGLVATRTSARRVGAIKVPGSVGPDGWVRPPTLSFSFVDPRGKRHD